MSYIHETAAIDALASLGEGVEVGPFSIVHANVNIRDGTKIGSHCEIGVPTPLSDGAPLIIGENSVIRSHSVFYEGSTFGNRLQTGHRVTVREKTVAGENLQIGTLSDLQGDIKIGDYVRLHSNVHIGKKSTIGSYVWIFPYVVLTNDPTPPSETLLGVSLGDYSIVATMSVILPGVSIGSHALVAASACVAKDVPNGMIAAGVPAKIIGETSKIKLKNLPDINAYPWPRHFKRGYPDHVVAAWLEEFGELS
jgi:acyl-[acyl carrier protein]--UDP-N-acetylglucosamine O-acyltransferase